MTSPDKMFICCRLSNFVWCPRFCCHNVSCRYMRILFFVIGDIRDSKVCTACEKHIRGFQILRNISVGAIMLDTNGTYMLIFMLSNFSQCILACQSRLDFLSWRYSWYFLFLSRVETFFFVQRLSCDSHRDTWVLEVVVVICRSGPWNRRQLAQSEWRKQRKVLTTSGTYPWSCVTHICLKTQPSHSGNRKTFEVMTSA